VARPPSGAALIQRTGGTLKRSPAEDQSVLATRSDLVQYKGDVRAAARGHKMTVGMRFTRFLAAVLFGLLLGWGGIAMPGAAAAAMPHHLMSMGEEAAADCDEQPGHQGHGDHQHQGDHKDPSTPSHQGCCVMACGGVLALEPTYLQVKPIERTPDRVQIVTDDMLRKRSVPPLRRPPRPAA
jgi:hypothetical protein